MSLCNVRLVEVPIRAHLVVDNNMNGAMCSVVGQVSKVKSLIDHTLSCEGCIAVEEDAHHLFALSVPPIELLGPSLALHHWVHSCRGQQQ